MSFTKKGLGDAAKSTEVIVCLSLDSRSEVNELVAKAVAAGGTTPNDSKDCGLMYQHRFQELDGHLWELIYMEPSKTYQG
jgi:hypothetical protein